MRRLVTFGFVAFLLVALVGFVFAQQTPGQGPMGPGGPGMMQQVGGMMQHIAEMMRSGQMKPERMEQMAKMMEQMSKMQKRGYGFLSRRRGWHGRSELASSDLDRLHQATVNRKGIEGALAM